MEAVGLATASEVPAQSAIPTSSPLALGIEGRRMPGMDHPVRMRRHRKQLPRTLGTSFSVKQANAAGVGRWRRDTSDLRRPFRGIRTSTAATTFADHIATHHPRMKPWHSYVGRTAVRLWGLPHPLPWKITEPVHIAVPHDRTPPRTKGVSGRRLSDARTVTAACGEVRVVDPITAIFTCADDLTLMNAVTLLDALISESKNYPGFVSERPIPVLDDVAVRLDEWRSFPGHRIIREAMRLARPGVESPKETETRLRIIDSGLPEPVVQHEVHDGGRFVARVDLAYPKLKIAIEYEGDGHRTSKEQWRRDIQRQRDLEDRGWFVIRLTQQDLDTGAESLLGRIRRAYLTRAA